MVYKRQLVFKHGCPSGCDTSKLLSDNLKNKLYYDGFQKVLYHYSHQEKPVHIVYWFFFFVCAMEGARTGRRRIAPQAISPVGCCLARGFQRLGMSNVEAVDRKISWLFCFVSHGCTVFARSVFSMSDYVGRCIALQSVPFFASGEQGQAELCLHFRVGILEQFQKSRHGDGGFACGG